MSWVLIIFVAQFGGLYSSTPAITITTINGYQSEAACNLAAKATETHAIKPLAWYIPGPENSK